MPRIQVSTLTGADLDRAVILALGYTIDADNCAVKDGVAEFNIDCFNPSEVWAQGGPIIEREAITLDTSMVRTAWVATSFHGEITASGPTPLTAAMRCYVASVFGDTVELD